MASLPVPAESRIAFSVKNTFIDAVSDDDELAADVQPSHALRSFTAPVVAVSDSESASCSESSALGSPKEEIREANCVAYCDSALPVLIGARRRRSLAKVPEAELLPTITVRNTFVDLPERSPSDGQARLSRCATAPVRSGSFSPPSTDEADDDSAAATPPPEDAVPSTPTPWAGGQCDVGSGGDFVPCSTPTPWGAGTTELGFYTLAAARPAPLMAPPMAPPMALAPPAAPPTAPAATMAPAPVVAAAQEAKGRILATSVDKGVAVRNMGDSCVVQWTLESSKLRGNQKQLISAPFEVTLREGAPPAVFKMMICGQKEGMETAFQKSGGLGAMCLKCCSEVAEEARRTTIVRFSVGSGHVTQAPRGPVSHQFHSSSVCALPKHQSIWDFGASSSGSSTFNISVEFSAETCAAARADVRCAP